jgi:pimeloyl-ACP methyl ester carboxylesterase
MNLNEKETLSDHPLPLNGERLMRIKIIIIFVLFSMLVMSCAKPVVSPTPIGVKPEPTSITATILEPMATYEESSCPMELPEGMVEGEDIVCGYATIAEEHSNPEGKMIRLAVAVVKSASDGPAPDPLVMLAGGPGGSALTTFIPLLATPGFEGFWSQRDVILMEQRGTLYSTPFLQCKEVFDFNMEKLARNLDYENEKASYLEAITECRDRIQAGGVNLSAYNSMESAADIVAVIRALGYDEFNLYGGSYGSLLAQHIMRDYPEDIRSVILDSVSPLRHEPNMLYKAQSMDRALRLLFEQCSADHDCNASFPNLETVYFATVDQLNAAPITLNLTDPSTGNSYDMILTGDRLITSTRNLFYATNALTLMPKIIYDVAAGNYTYIEAVQSLFLFQQDIADGLYKSVICSELADFTLAEMAGSEDLYPQVAEVVEELIGEVMLDPCEVWSVDMLSEDKLKSVVSDIPTLLLSGEFDPTVPPPVGAVAAEGLSNAYVYSFPGYGHGILGIGECPVSMMLTFLDDPSRAPNASCMADMGAEFVSLYEDTNGLFSIPVLPDWIVDEADGYIMLASQEDEITISVLAVEGEDFIETSRAAWALIDPEFDFDPQIAELPCIGCAAGDAEKFAFIDYDIGTDDRFVLAIGWLYEGVVYFEIWQADASVIEEHFATLEIMVTGFTINALKIAESTTPSTEEVGSESEITLVPFTSDVFSIRGVVPEGWNEVAPGTFARGNSASDIAVLLLQAAPISADDLLGTLIGQLGLDEAPESVGEREANNLTWTFYNVEIQGISRDIGLAESGGVAFIVILRSEVSERDTLFEAVFLPAVDELVPLE